jgi:serine/threonine protein kinase
LYRRWWNRQFGRPIGTLSFMSPEQAVGGPFSVATDIYGLGACLYAILTGQSPHRGTREERLDRLRKQRPVPLLHPSVAALIPDSLLSLAYHCMEPNPADRPGSALQVKELLETARRSTDLLPRRFAPQGTILAQEGDPGDTAWYVVAGAVDVHQSGRGLVRTVRSGDVVGELAPVLGRRRTATLTVREDAILAVLTGQLLRDSSTIGPIGAQLFQSIAERMLVLERPIKAQGL